MPQYNIKEDIRALSLCTVLLFLKMTFVAFYTGWSRGKEGTPAAPEDRRGGADPGSAQPLTGRTTESKVDRGLAMHRNDLENIPIFLILSILLLFTSSSKYASHIAHIVFYSVFTAARFGHTLFYIVAIGPARSACWAVGLLCTFGVAIHLLVQAFSYA